ncbi:hypothetical protein CAEBREN_15029 [Caenorhabditis brenneri]|uniref:Uncharacterized protein n=1 Tax=Caenorhabditis brenneri TaxID=135651 RepID=G0N5H0_CAEBE|nr:hypothetical protein CAEBREN_15029 [Caenorhabditis brenneri]
MNQMWPRGFPLEHIEKHTNENSSQVLCYKMKRAAVQQGLVHHDPDVDAIYRLLHADSNSGLDVKFNKFTPLITLSVGTYSPWNSQNTLFHKSAFHTLFLPTTVSFRTTDIWRSFISQKILHLSGLTVSFVPTNAVQFRNAHDYLKDFKDENQVYEDSGKMIEFLHKWKCSNESSNSLEECINQLSDDMVINGLWGVEDSELMKMFLSDLKSMGRINLEFELVDPKEDEEQGLRKAIQKLNYFGDIIEWCNETGYSNLTESFRSPEQLKKKHDESYVLQKNLNSVKVFSYGVVELFLTRTIIKPLNPTNSFPAAERIVETVRNSRDEKLFKAWEKYENGLKKYGYINETETAESGFYYIPTSESDYYATLMSLFYKSKFFLELAVNAFLKSVNHQTSLLEKKSYLWGEKRPKWASFYNKDLVGMHTVKISQFRIPGTQRTDYCRTIIQTWSDIMFGGSQNFTIKNDTDADYRNG